MLYLGEKRWVRSPQQGGWSLDEGLYSLFPNLRYVWVIWLGECFRQAVLLVKAKQSTEWKAMSAQPQRSDAARARQLPTLSTSLFTVLLDEEGAPGRSTSTMWVSRRSRRHPTRIWFVTTQPTIRRLLAHVNRCLPTQYVFLSPRLHKQADDRFEQWVERYHRDARSRRAWRTVANLPHLLGQMMLTRDVCIAACAHAD